MDTKVIDSKIEVINSYLELLKSSIKAIGFGIEVRNFDIRVNSLKIEVTKVETYIDKLITEVNTFKIEVTSLKTEAASIESTFEIRDEKLWKLLKIEMKKEPGTRYRYDRVPAFLAAIFLLIAKRVNCSSYEIKSEYKLNPPSYDRYMRCLRQWEWVEYVPGRKKEIFMLSKKGNEILQKVLSSNN